MCSLKKLISILSCDNNLHGDFDPIFRETNGCFLENVQEIAELIEINQSVIHIAGCWFLMLFCLYIAL